MPRRLLDLAALHAGRLPGAPPAGRPPAAAARGALRRRHLLAAAAAAVGAAGVGWAPAEPTRRGAAAGVRALPFGWEVSLPGCPPWVVDARCFGGRPRATVERRRDPPEWVLSLAEATYPGTRLPADLRCRLRPAAGGAWASFRLALGGLRATVPLAAWLRGEVAARAPVALAHPALAASTARLRLDGRGRGAFSPMWHLVLEGAALASLRTPRGEARASRVELRLLPPGSPSAMRAEADWRTLLVAPQATGTGAWLRGLSAQGRGFELDGDPVAEVRVEAAGRGAPARLAVVAEVREGPGAMLRFRPAAAARESARSGPVLGLQGVRYAFAADGRGWEEAVVGRLGGPPVWLRAGGCAVQVGGGPAAAPFEAVYRDGLAVRVRCAPEVRAVAAPLGGAIAAVAPPRGSARRLELAWPDVAARAAALPSSYTFRTAPAVDAALAAGGAPGAGGHGILHLGNPTVSVLRPDDLLALTFEFANLHLVSDAGGAWLERTATGVDAQVTVHFPPQHVGEESFAEAATPGGPGDEVPSPPPVRSRLAGPSRLAFTLPPERNRLPYTLESLLDWSEWSLVVAPTASPPPLLPAIRAVLPGVRPGAKLLLAAPPPGVAYRQPPPAGRGAAPRARASGRASRAVPRFVPSSANLQAAYVAAYDLAPPGSPSGSTAALVTPPGLRGGQGLVVVPRSNPQVAPPDPSVTALEIPYRLILSPSWLEGFTHAVRPVARRAAGHDWVELWHSRLGVRLQGPDGAWTVDESPGTAPLRTLRAIWSPDFDPRHPVAGTVGPFRMPLDGSTRNQIVHLSADQGDAAYAVPLQADRLVLSALGAWLDVQGSWPASPLNVVAWTHRATMGRDQYVRVMYQGYLFPFGHRASVIQVTERQLWPDGSGDGRAAYLRTYLYLVVRQPLRTFPAEGRRGRQTPLRTVRLTTLTTPRLDPADPNAPFWPQVGGKDFAFGLLAEDWDGRSVQLDAPLAWVPESAAADAAVLQSLAQAYAADGARSTRPAAGQTVALAPSRAPGDTAYAADALTFGAEVADPHEVLAAGEPRFFPLLSQALVHVAAVEQLAGSAGAVPVALAETFLASGFDPVANAGEVFAALVQALPVQFSDLQQVGGVVTPDLGASGLSRLFGTVGAGDLAAFAAGHFDPAQLFSASARLLGGLPLSDLLQPLTFQGPDAAVPTLASRVVYRQDAHGHEDPTLGPQAVQTTWKWATRLRSSGPFVSNDPAGSPLELQAVLLAPLDGTPPTYRVDGSLKDFTIQLLPPLAVFLEVAFQKLSFRARSGEQLAVTPDIGGVRFVGVLAFVDTLERFLSQAVLGDGPSLDVGPQGVTAGFQLPIPSVGIGVFSLQNITLGSLLNIPFDGSPARYRFQFAERQHPFQLTVGPFGGGGFFQIALGLDGVENLEAALEFGGAFSLNLGVASGGVSVMAGIYYAMKGGTASLTGYLHAGGGLNVLGVVSVTVEFYLGLQYDISRDKVWGQASLTVDVSVLLFHASVALTMEREFAGAHGDPTFAELMGPDAELPRGYQNYWQLYAEAFA